MSDLEKLFEHAPEGAVAILVKVNKKTLRYVNSEDKVWFGGDWVSCADGDTKTIATRPQQPRKTVEDAVEYYGGDWTERYCDRLAFNPKCNIFGGYRAPRGHNTSCYHVCTREQFEAFVAAKAKSEPEWTHIGMRNQKCVILAQIANKAWIKYDDGRECVKPITDLKPIKPTISRAAKEQLEFYVQYRVDKYGDHAMKSDLIDYLAKHEVVK